MKLVRFGCLLLCIGIAMKNNAFDATETVNGITWTYTVSNGEASVGGGSSSATAVPTTTMGSITIPSKLGGNSVTSIGSAAFKNCSGLTSVTIPNSVTNIGNQAFYGCSGLTSVTIPNSVTSIEHNTFYGCSGLTSVTIPNSVTSIGTGAFYGCTGLTSVTIPNSVTSIGSSAFGYCRGLTSMTIPNCVTNLQVQAFANCSELTNFVFEGNTFFRSFGLGEATPVMGCEKLLATWYRTLANISAAGGEIAKPSDLPYMLSNTPADRAIASVTVDGDRAIDDFVLQDGKVYDSVLYIKNTAATPVTLTLPSGSVYMAHKWTHPLVLPAKSSSILSITRVAENEFLVARQDLVVMQ